jgi:probable HAF family extracellular repeat protein
MTLIRPLFLLFPLITLSLVGCHPSQTQVAPLPGSAHPAYTIADLGVGTPSGMNNRGQVIGHFPAGVFPNSKGFPYFHGCLWDKGRRIEMPTLGGWYSQADSISSHTLILGTATVAGLGSPSHPVTHQCLWDGHRLTDLEADPRFRGTRAIHITQFGGVYAVSPPQGAKKQFHLWLFPAGFSPGSHLDQGIIGGRILKPMFINDSGMVTGTWNTGEKRNGAQFRQAFVWHRGAKNWTSLGTFGGLDSQPSGLNNSGQIIGDAALVDDMTAHTWRAHAFFWKKGKMQDLGALPGSRYSTASAFNGKGQIIGVSEAGRNKTGIIPVIWEKGQIKELRQLIPAGTNWISLGEAADINEKGQIVGSGAVENDRQKDTFPNHAFLLTTR